MKHARSSVRKLSNAWGLVSLAILIGGCAIPIRHGDAIVWDRKDVLFVVVDDLVFPWMSLDSRHVYHFKARHLPAAVYPDRVELRYPHELPARSKSASAEHRELKMSREEIQRTNQVWRHSSLRIQFQRTDGHPFFERTVNLEPQRGGPSYDERRGTAVFQLFWESARGSISSITNYDYDVEVEVIPPTENLPIEARLFTQRKIY